MKKNKTRALLLTSLSFIGMVFSIIFYVMSIKVNADGYGTDYSCNYDYIITFIIFLIIFVLGIYELYYSLKNKECKDYSFLATTLVLALGASYTLSVFFTALSKGNFDYISNQFYLYIGVAALILLIICLIYYKKRNKN